MNIEGLYDLKIAEIAFQEMLKDWGISEHDCLDLLSSKWQTSEKELGFDLANDTLFRQLDLVAHLGAHVADQPVALLRRLGVLRRRLVLEISGWACISS